MADPTVIPAGQPGAKDLTDSLAVEPVLHIRTQKLTTIDIGPEAIDQRRLSSLIQPLDQHGKTCP